MNRNVATGLAALAAVWGLAIGLARADDWTYVVPPAGDPMEHPPLRALALSAEKPDGLKEDVAYRGTRRQYAQVRFGSRDSTQVAVVLDHVFAGEVDLYVDTYRTRVITSRELVGGSGRTWRMPLDMAIGYDVGAKFTARRVIFELGRTGQTLGFAACGYLEGKVRLGGQTCTRAKGGRRRQRAVRRSAGPDLDRPERRRAVGPAGRAVSLRPDSHDRIGALRRPRG